MNISGRVAALAISPNCLVTRPCRLWVGTAGGGVWRTDDAMNTTDVGWRWVSEGLGTNSIGSLALDPNDRAGNTILVGTGETNQPNNSAAGTGVYRSIDGGDHWTRIPTMIVDPTVSPVAMDFTFTRGIGSVVVEPGNSQTIYVATTSAMLGMTAVRGGQTQTTGFPQPRVGLYKTTNAGTTWSLIWVPPLDPVVPPNPNLGEGVGDTMFGVRHVGARSQGPAHRLRDRVEQRDSPIGAGAGRRRRDFQAGVRGRQPSAVPGSGDVRSHAEGWSHADVCLQRHAQPERSGVVPARQCGCASLDAGTRDRVPPSSTRARG